MEYPQQTKIHGMLELIHRELEKADERGDSELGVICIAGGEEAGVYIGVSPAPEYNASTTLGISGSEALRLFKYVCREGYVGLSPESDLTKSFSYVTVDYLTSFGLLEIGALPDPQQRFLMGLEAAIQVIREDDRIPEDEKKKGIDWAEEGKQLGRPLMVEVIKAMFRGDLPLS